jgi:hypothetical protein
MAKTQVGGLRTIGAREAAEAGVESDLSVPEQINEKFKHVFQSRKSAFVISLARRVIHWDMTTGNKEEEVPMSKDGNRLDLVRFTDHFFRTNDDEIAAAFEALGKKKPEVFGMEGLCWRYEDKVKEQRAARAAELRAALAADPDLAREVGALVPSNKKDWSEAELPKSRLVDVETKKAAPPTRASRSADDMTAEELEAATAPAPR